MPALLLITHKNIGRSMLDIAEAIIGNNTTDITCIDVPMDGDLQKITVQANTFINNHTETLVMTDIYGSTPANIATQLAKHDHCAAVCGINLSMLLRAINYQSLPLAELIEKTIDGGKRGVISCE